MTNLQGELVSMKNYFILKSPKNLDQEAFKNTNLNFVLPFYPCLKSGVYDKKFCRIRNKMSHNVSFIYTFNYRNASTIFAKQSKLAFWTFNIKSLVNKSKVSEIFMESFSLNHSNNSDYYAINLFIH